MLRVPKDAQWLQVSLYLDSRQSSKFAVTKSVRIPYVLLHESIFRAICWHALS